MIKKNDELVVDIVSIGCNGEGVAKVDGQVIFVPYAMLGEKVRVVIINAKKKTLIAKVLSVIVPSTDRVQPVCPYFTKCGGCQLQHVQYDKALSYKTNIIQDAVSRIGKIDYNVLPTIASDKIYGYRNKMALPVNIRTRQVGMYRNGTHNIIDICDCSIQEPWANDIIEVFNRFLSLSNITIYDETKGVGDVRHLVVRHYDDKFLITVVVNSDQLQDQEVLVGLLKERFTNFGLNININKTMGNLILSNHYKHIYGLKSIDICEFQINYEITNASFMQVNNYIKGLMYSRVLDEVDALDVVVDAYSGAGLLTAMLSKKCKYAYGIEIVEPAVKIANELKQKNQITNMTNICGDSAIELPKLLEQNIGEFVLVLDPPRKGCSPIVLDTIIKVKPKKIIYISCDPSTLARDLNILNEQNLYDIKLIQGYDMFPQTKHVETLAILSIKNT